MTKHQLLCYVLQEAHLKLTDPGGCSFYGGISEPDMLYMRQQAVKILQIVVDELGEEAPLEFLIMFEDLRERALPQVEGPGTAAKHA